MGEGRDDWAITLASLKLPDPSTSDFAVVILYIANACTGTVRSPSCCYCTHIKWVELFHDGSPEIVMGGTSAQVPLGLLRPCGSHSMGFRTGTMVSTRPSRPSSKVGQWRVNRNGRGRHGASVMRAAT